MVVGDIGSTFTKLMAVTELGQTVISRQVRTRREAIAEGAAAAVTQLKADLAREGREVERFDLSSSAGGGLRVLVVGIEPKLTLEAGRKASETAGARIVASWTLAELVQRGHADLERIAPDLALLTGGTDGGAVDAIDAAKVLRTLAPALPVVVAANEATYDAVARALGSNRIVRFAANLMPSVGQLAGESAQAEIRALFVDHVIASVKLAARPEIASAVRLPTPAAVLRAAETIATSGLPGFERPVVVDLGGATTDVHSVISLDDAERGYVSSGIEPQRITRTVEGDLGMRESAATLVRAARADGWLDDLAPDRIAALERGAERRIHERGFLPEDDAERALDEQLAQLATEIAVARHAGALRTTLTATGAVLRKTGRDLRKASCVIVTGGVFRHAQRAAEIVAAAWERVAARGGLVKAGPPVFVDREYQLWAVGLLSAEHRGVADALLARTFEPVSR
ncbi:MAG: hypothetical protein EDQ89_01230 [Acidobacteria bacterium]|nr:MAG: hypothetical protein EDQ89_01230 [Acidobacteriota bacterium]